MGHRVLILIFDRTPQSAFLVWTTAQAKRWTHSTGGNMCSNSESTIALTCPPARPKPVARRASQPVWRACRTCRRCASRSCKTSC
eukprot:6478162-Prymnesium_polylepis.1